MRECTWSTSGGRLVCLRVQTQAWALSLRHLEIKKPSCFTVLSREINKTKKRRHLRVFEASPLYLRFTRETLVFYSIYS
jgi:hypothetical protein